jgi:hypothetical protein
MVWTYKDLFVFKFTFTQTYIEWRKISHNNTKDETYMFCISLTCILPIDLKFNPYASYMMKTHYTRPKLTIQSPFLESKFSDFFL